ncbi:MAG: tRNA guanosine(34) transglycosylase Tgt [Rickettsiales bacterium]|nr:tRNA guanosine(34) transglycosylase Tgt [Rickettsiales bacterium]
MKKKKKFNIISVFEKTRTGLIETAHGNIKTPVFMPVGTLANVKSIFPRDLEELGIQIILGNTYHLMLRPGEKIIKKIGGIQKFMNWNKPVLTDSGGFQAWSLTKLREIDINGITFNSHLDGKKYRLTPEKSIQIQHSLNSNISMVLDECTEFPSTYKRTLDSLNLTKHWAEKSLLSFKKRNGYYLFSIIQGGMYKSLRKKSCDQLTGMEFDGYALGGLSVGESHKKMTKVVEFTTQFMPEDKPRYLMGVGRPVDIFKGVENGIDMFDCVLPTRFGRNGRAFSSTLGEINLRNNCFANDFSPLDKNIDCYASKNFSKSYIHHLTKSNEILSSMILSLHNIAFYEKMMLDIRESIENKSFKKIMKKYLDVHMCYEKT